MTLNMKKLALTAVGYCALTLNSGVAFSSTTHANAEIDWGTFSITGYGLGPGAAPTFNLQTQGSTSSSNTSDWINWSSNITNNTSLFAASTEGTGTGNGNASAQRNASLTIFGSGFLVISAHYSLSAALNGTGDCGNYYCNPDQASSSVSFSLTNTSTPGSQHTSNSSQGISLSGNYYPWYPTPLTSDQKEGLLTVGVLVNNGDVLNFSSSVSASASDNYAGQPVPIPAAIWLFGTAMAGLLGTNRRNNAFTA